MFSIMEYLIRLMNKKEPSGNFVDNETEKKIKCQRCLRRFDSHYVKCSYCNCSEFFESISVYFYILRN